MLFVLLFRLIFILYVRLLNNDPHPGLVLLEAAPPLECELGVLLF